MTFWYGTGLTAIQILRKRLAPQKKAKQINKMRKAQRTMGAKDIDVSTFGFDFQLVHSGNWRDTPIPPPQNLACGQILATNCSELRGPPTAKHTRKNFRENKGQLLSGQYYKRTTRDRSGSICLRSRFSFLYGNLKIENYE
jgi:hypothetical protein